MKQRRGDREGAVATVESSVVGGECMSNPFVAIIHSAQRCAREWQATAERAHAVAVKLADRLGINAEGTS
jgi:hypothetical protein